MVSSNENDMRGIDMRKHLPALGLSLLAALGLMAFAVSSAQAGEIKVGGSASLATGTEFSGESLGDTVYLFPSLGYEIVCKKKTILMSNIFGPNSIVQGSMSYTSCKIFPIDKATKKLISSESLPCTVEEPIVDKGSGEVGLHEGRSYLLFKSTEGTPLAIIKLSGAECTLPAKNEVTGTQVIKVVTGDLNVGAEVVEPSLEESDAIQELLKGELLVGKSKAFLMSSAKVKISSPIADVGKTMGFK